MNDFLAQTAIDLEDEKRAAQVAAAANIMEYERLGDVRYYHNLEQGCAEWLRLRLGMFTASEMNKILTPTLKVANNAETRKQVFELLAQRITQHVEPHFVSYDMERGKMEEVDARVEYEKHYAPVQQCGFIINNNLGFDVGFSPDGLVGDLGMIEIKSRMAKYQVQTILEHMGVADPVSVIPVEFMLQVQTGLWVTEREWCDFISYSNGLNMIVIRVYPDPDYFEAIQKALIATDERIKELMKAYVRTTTADGARVHPVERTDYSEELTA